MWVCVGAYNKGALANSVILLLFPYFCIYRCCYPNTRCFCCFPSLFCVLLVLVWYILFLSFSLPAFPFSGSGVIVIAIYLATFPGAFGAFCPATYTQVVSVAMQTTRKLLRFVRICQMELQ